MRREVGVCYYPEHWPEAEWPEDARRMVEAGIAWVRIGEFAWSRLEPEPGRLEFKWLDLAVETLGAAGMKLILGTPTATPPRWMLDRYPDMLPVDAEGRPRKFGSRRHYCFSHLGYRDEARRIARLLAERYGESLHIQAWQIDNEYGCHDTTLTYSAAARDGFRDWLRARYGDINALNEAWGNVFWSMEYDGFEQIDLPNLTVTTPNPAHALDFRRYSSDQVVAFNRAQVEEIRSRSPGRTILHNYMGRITDFDHFTVGADLDAASWDSYPLGFLEDRLGADDDHILRHMRQGDPDFQAFHHDLYRAVGKGRFWVMEQQPGPVNWAPHNPTPLPGMPRLWAWEAFAHGAEMVSYFRWRQAPMAQEQMHAGLLLPNGEAAPGLAEAVQVARECAGNEMGGVEATSASVAIVFDYPSDWAWQAQPQGAGFSYFALVFDLFRALRRQGLDVDIIRASTDDLSRWKLVLIPGLMGWTGALRNAMANYEGVALVGPRTGSKTADFAIPGVLPPDLPDLLDLTVTHVESLRPDAPVPLSDGGVFRGWREFIAPGADAEVVETCVDGPPALLRQSGVHYLAGWPDVAAADRIIVRLARLAELETVALPESLRIRRAGDWTFVVNYGPDAARLPASKLFEGERHLDLATNDTLTPAGVGAIRRNSNI